MIITEYQEHKLHRFYRDEEGMLSDTDQGYYEHDCELPDGSFRLMDVQVNSLVQTRTFREWIDLGYPDRYTLGVYHEPLSALDIATAWDKVFPIRSRNKFEP